METLVHDFGATAASLFLFSKTGTLARVATSGSPIEVEENYVRDKDAVYLCAEPDDEDAYGRSVVLNWPFNGVSEQFRSAFGHLLDQGSQVVYLPLNGPNRSYGVIRLVGVSSPDERPAFTDDDLSDLEVFGHQVATSISSLRRKLELDIVARVNDILTADPTNVTRAYEHVATALVSQWTEYAACSIRIRHRHGDLRLETLSTATGVTTRDKDRYDRPPDVGFISRALESGEPVVIEDVPAHLAEFYDPAWLETNRFKTAAIFPIRSQTENIGTLAVYVWYDYTFYETKLRFLKQLCRQLGTATAIVRLLTSRERLIQQMSDIISEPASQRDLLQSIIASACDLTGAEQGYIAIRSNRDARLHPDVYAGGLLADQVPTIDIAGPGLTALAARTATTVRCNDVHTDPILAPVYVDFVGDAAGRTKSELVVPLTHTSRVIGVIAVDSSHRQCFSDNDVLLLETLARYAALVFQRDRLLDATMRLANIEFSRRDRRRVFVQIAKSAAELVDADASIVLLLDGVTDHLYTETHYPDGVNIHTADSVLPRGVGACWDALRSHDVVVFRDILNDPLFHNRAFATANGFTEMVSVPLMVGGSGTDADRDLGVINLFFRTASPFIDIDRQVLRILGAGASLAIHDLSAIEETTRTHALATITARTTAAIEVSGRLVREALIPLRQARDAAAALSSQSTAERAALHARRLTGALNALTSLLNKLAPSEPIPETLPHTPSSVLTDAFRLLNTRLFGTEPQPSLSIGEDELWRHVALALRRLIDLIRLPSAALYISHHRDYREFRRVVSTTPGTTVERFGLPSFEEFSWLQQQTYTVLPHEDSRLEWIDIRGMAAAPRAVIFGHEVTGGRLIVLVFGLQEHRALAFSEIATLYEAVTAQLYPYVDNAMFGIELDFLTSETGHLLGRAIGKVQSGVRTLNELGPMTANSSEEDIRLHTLAGHAVEDGLIRLELIRNNFYWFSAQRRHFDVGGEEQSGDVSQAMTRTFDVVALLHDMRGLFTREATERGLKATHMDLRPSRAEVRGPETLLRLTFLNLFDNALKFAYANTFIEISLRSSAETCTVVFQNLGVGVAPDEVEAVFQRLRRSRFQDTSRRIEGLGLGLPYCRRVVKEVFRGDIGLSSRAAETPSVRRFEGDNWLTTVTVTLPLAAQRERVGRWRDR